MVTQKRHIGDNIRVLVMELGHYRCRGNVYTRTIGTYVIVQIHPKK